MYLDIKPKTPCELTLQVWKGNNSNVFFTLLILSSINVKQSLTNFYPVQCYKSIMKDLFSIITLIILKLKF